MCFEFLCCHHEEDGGSDHHDSGISPNSSLGHKKEDERNPKSNNGYLNAVENFSQDGSPKTNNGYFKAVENIPQDRNPKPNNKGHLNTIEKVSQGEKNPTIINYHLNANGGIYVNGEEEVAKGVQTNMKNGPSEETKFHGSIESNGFANDGYSSTVYDAKKRKPIVNNY